MLLLNLKLYIKTPSILFITVLYFLHLGYMIGTDLFTNIDFGFTLYLNQIRITFIFFLFISYEYFSKVKRDKVEEVLEAGRRGLLIKLSGIWVFVIIDLMISGILFAYSCFAGMIQGLHSWSYVWFLVKCTCIHHFLVYMFAIMTGLTVSFVKSRTTGYVILMAVCCITGATFIAPLIRASWGKEAVYRIADLLSITTREYNALPNRYYMFSVEAVNIQRILFWIFLMISIFCIVLWKRKKCYAVIAPVIAMLICAVLFFQPVSAAYVDIGMGQDSWTADENYYKIREVVDCNDTSQYKEADFKALKYVMQIDIKRELKAVVDVYVDQDKKVSSTLQQYDFTLYHGYKVDRVLNARGKEMDFLQEEDYVSVYADPATDTQKLTFQYHGHSKRHYSTDQGMFLPAYLEYYPVPGRRQVYMAEYYYEGNTLEGLGYEADFDVTVNTDQKVYSNLKTGKDGHMTGRSDGVTLLSSPFAAEMQVRNCKIVYSVLEYPDEKLEEQKAQFRQFIDRYTGKESVDGKMIFIPPEINGSSYYFGSDHLLGNIVFLSSGYERYVTEGQRYPYISEEEVQEELEKVK